MDTMQKLSLIIIIILIPFISLSQGDERYQKYVNRDYSFLRVSETTPTVAEFQAMKHFDFPKCNGKLNVSLPLYTANYKNASIPIYLAYNTAGIKVNGVASRVGQNWHLNAGGKITRTQKGSMLDFDRDDNGVASPGFVVEYYGWQRHNETVGTNMRLHDENAEIYDLEPDVFFLSAPDLTTQFIINKDHKAVEIKGDDIKIKNLVFKNSIGAYDNEILAFKILSSNGVYYNFSKITRIINTTEGRGVTYPIQDWHLTEMILPTGEKITFEYDDGGSDLSYFRQLFKVHGYPNTYHETNIPIESETDNGRVQLNSPTRLVKINFNTGYVSFVYNHTRQDIPGDEALSSVKIYNYNDKLVKSIDLNYEYINNLSGNPSRLLLNQLVFKNAQNETHKEYDLEYYDGIGYFPAYNSFKYDCFGYFADHGQSSYDVKLYAYIPSSISQTEYYPFSLGSVSGHDVVTLGANNRTPNANHIKTGMLKRIDYPTGGYMELEYESNRFVIKGKIIEGGGLRVKSQSLKDVDVDWEKTYVYEQPFVKLPRFATFAKYISNPSALSSQEKIQLVGGASSVRYEDNQVNSELFDGSPVMYAKVTEVQTGNGKIIHYFNVNSDYAPGKSFNAPTGYQNYFYYNNKSGWPFWSGRTQSPLRGKTEEVLYFDESGKMIKGEIFEYIFKAYSIEDVNTVTGRYYKQWQGTEYSDLAKISGTYSIVPGDARLIRKRTVEVPDGVTPDDRRLSIQIDASATLEDELLIEEETYTYNDFGQVSYHGFKESNGSLMGNIYWYASDYLSYNMNGDVLYYSNTEGKLKVMSDMFEGNYMVGVPIETIYRKYDGDAPYLLGANFNEFIRIYNSSIGSWMTLNSKNYTFNIDEPQYLSGQGMDIKKATVKYNSSTSKYYLDLSSSYETLNEFEYTDKGNLVTTNYADDVKVGYDWNYNFSYPVAKATNTKNKRIFYTGFEEPPGDGQGTVLFGYGSTIIEGTLSNDAKSGDHSLFDVTGHIYFEKAGEYVISFFVKGDGELFSFDTPINTNDWIFFSETVNITSSGTFDFIAGRLNVDDLRVFPKGAQMTTYTYEPLIGMTSQSDPNNKTTTYKYDDFGRLEFVKDHNGNVLNKYTYHYKEGETTGGSTGGSSTVLNVGVSNILFKNGIYSTTINITSNVNWTILSSAWLTLSSNSGSNNQTITVSGNEVLGDQTGTITISGGGITRTIRVTQLGTGGSDTL